MEGSLEDIALQRSGNRIVVMQISVPFAVTFIDKILPDVRFRLAPKLKVLFFSEQLVGKPCGDDRFALRPPKLHVPFKCGRRSSRHVGKRNDPAVLLIPAERQGDIDDPFAQAEHFPIARQNALEHDEPRGFHRMTRIDGPSRRRIPTLFCSPLKKINTQSTSRSRSGSCVRHNPAHI